jgi:hypothetical protein
MSNNVVQIVEERNVRLDTRNQCLRGVTRPLAGMTRSDTLPRTSAVKVTVLKASSAARSSVVFVIMRTSPR